MKKILIILFSGLLAGSILIGCQSADQQVTDESTTSNQIIESAEYTAKRENEPYPFEQKLVNANGTYQLKEVSYETLSSKPITKTETITTTKEVTDLYAKEVDAEKELSFTANGQPVLGTLSDITYQDTVITNRTTTLDAAITSGYVIAQLSPAQTKTTQYYDEPSGQMVTRTLPLTNTALTTPYHWLSDVVVPMQIQVYDASFYKLNGRYVPYNEEKPALTGYESDILTVLNLPQASYRITDFLWNGAVYVKDGILYRNATAIGQRYVAEYTSYYSDTVTLPDAPGYNAVLTYAADVTADTNETEYTINATAVYEKNIGLSPTQIITISVVGVFLLIAIIIGILFILSKHKKQK